MLTFRKLCYFSINFLTVVVLFCHYLHRRAPDQSVAIFFTKSPFLLIFWSVHGKCPKQNAFAV